MPLDPHRLLGLAFASADALFEIDAEGRLSFAVGATAALAPGGETDEDDPHEGEEFGYVLSGTIRVVLGDRSERVRRDESFCFRPNAPHKLVNAGKSTCRVLWVSTPPSF